ncbi:GNAT family N-acetyltransferase [Roseibium aquae]|uniref:GNAT family N-acetyltransferase n=1 Tax=Roseibium aquae TaxID=1323746 RepID=UPI001AD90CC2|nr:GNAT family N-acetyltransferase [Roseibium aquae]
MTSGPVRLVPFEADDLGQVQQLWSDPRAARFISSDNNTWSAAAASGFIDQAIADQQRHGFSRWKVLGPDGRFFGWAGFTALEETSEIELDYCLALETFEVFPNLPGQLCQDLVDWFFENTYFSHLVSVVRTDNRMVREVMLDAGFYFRESRQIGGMPCDVFQILSPSMQSYVLTA